MMGHQHLLDAGHELLRGIGRRVHGSQVSSDEIDSCRPSDAMLLCFCTVPACNQVPIGCSCSIIELLLTLERSSITGMTPVTSC